MNELTPTGKLRVGLAFAPAPSPLFVVKGKDHVPRGVTVDLAGELAQQLGVPVEFTLAPNTGELVDALAAGTIDVSFMPVDEERKARIDFGPVYFLVESTYLATAASRIATVEEVDRAGVRVIGIANTTTIRAAGRTLKNTSIKAVQSIGEAVEMLGAGKADAFALSRDSLPPFAAMLAGSRIVDGAFQLTGVAIAVPKGRPQALAAVTAFLDKAKNTGLVRRAFDRAGLEHLLVAP
jgi:polar amino acid transport system substrate-binding protein